MGLGGISLAQLLIIFLIVLLFFGPKRLASLGEELGSALKGFKRAFREDEVKTKDPE